MELHSGEEDAQLTEIIINYIFKQDVDLLGYVLYIVILYMNYT